jgi:YVTN family beta-propeller protein
MNGLAPQVAEVTPRVYVPNEKSNSVTIIDPNTYAVVGRIAVGSSPEHVTPSYDLRSLYVNDNGLTEIDPKTATVRRKVPVAMPYNLYFTPDGTKAIVVAEELHRLDFYDATSWAFLKSVPIPWNGIDHMDFSADGSFALASCEFAGKLAKIDVNAMTLADSVSVGGFPVDVKLAPAGDVFFVTNQARDGVSVIDAKTLKEVGFIQTGKGAHGLAISRDTRSLYVSNRLAGTISVIDVASRTVRANWVVGGSPDMLTLNVDGTELWTGNRFANTVIVVSTESGKVTHTITVEDRPHGLTFFPQPGRYSLGHNGVYR